MRMEVTIKFDRDIKPEKHYISPGGYEMTFSNGKTVQFDFMDYVGSICADDSTRLTCEMCTLDTGCFPDAKFLETFTGSITEIKEFFVYTGEDNEPEINPVELVDLWMWNGDAKEITYDKKLLGRIWDKQKEE